MYQTKCYKIRMCNILKIKKCSSHVLFVETLPDILGAETQGTWESGFGLRNAENFYPALRFVSHLFDFSTSVAISKLTTSKRHLVTAYLQQKQSWFESKRFFVFCTVLSDFHIKNSIGTKSARSACTICFFFQNPHRSCAILVPKQKTRTELFSQLIGWHSSRIKQTGGSSDSSIHVSFCFSHPIRK